MKIEIKTTIDVGDKFDHLSDDDISQYVYMDYVNYVVCSHMRDACNWCSKAKGGTEKELLTEKTIWKRHEFWGDITSNQKYVITKITEDDGNSTSKIISQDK